MPEPASSSACTSSAERKSSNCTTHGSRESTVGEYAAHVSDVAHSMAAAMPSPAAAPRSAGTSVGSRTHRTFGSRKWHVRHDFAHSTIMKPGFASHSPIPAHLSQSGLVFSHAVCAGSSAAGAARHVEPSAQVSSAEEDGCSHVSEDGSQAA